MSVSASHITGKSAICSTACSCWQKTKTPQIPTLFAPFAHKRPLMRQEFICHDVTMLNVASVTLVQVPFSWLALDSYGEVKGQCNLPLQVYITLNPYLISPNYCCRVENFCILTYDLDNKLLLPRNSCSREPQTHTRFLSNVPLLIQPSISQGKTRIYPVRWTSSTEDKLGGILGTVKLFCGVCYRELTI